MKPYTRRSAPAWLIDVDSWPTADLDGLPNEVKAEALNKKGAVTKYVAGDPVSEIEEEHGIFRQQILRDFRRCLSFDSDGKQLCWRALIRGLRWHAPVRRKPLVACGRSGRGGLSGAMAKLLADHPEVESKFRDYLWSTAKRRSGHERKIRHKSAHTKFLDICTSSGVGEDEWPRNTQKLGRGAVHVYVKQFIAENYSSIVSGQFGSKAATKANTGTGQFSRLIACMPFDIVELDEHRCHFIGAIALDTPGGPRWVVAPRITIIAIADRKFGLVLGWKAIFRREASGDDVLDVLHEASTGGPPRTDASADRRYAFPRDVGPALCWIGFSQLLVDNALIHIVQEVLQRGRGLIGCDINFGPVARPERRPVIEGVFSELEVHGFHRMRETTGSSPQDALRQLDDVPLDQRIDQKRAIALIGAAFEKHNRRTAKGTFGIRRIEQLALMLTDPKLGMIAPALPPMSADQPSLQMSVLKLKVSGNMDRGRRPSVYFQEEEYFGEELSGSWDLVGKWVRAHLVRSDARSMTLYRLDGTLIGEVKVRGRWRHAAHTVDQRIEANKLIRDGYLRVEWDEDPLAAIAVKVAEEVDARGKIPAVFQPSVVSLLEKEAMHACAGPGDSDHEDAETEILQESPKESAGREECSGDTQLDDLLAMDELGALNGSFS